jgi:hypothetical protein
MAMDWYSASRGQRSPRLLLLAGCGIQRLCVAVEQEWPVRVLCVDFVLNRGYLVQKYFALLRTHCPESPGTTR